MPWRRVDSQHLTAEVWREGIQAGELVTVQIIPAEWCQAMAEVVRENQAHGPEVGRIGTAARCPPPGTGPEWCIVRPRARPGTKKQCHPDPGRRIYLGIPEMNGVETASFLA